MYGIIKKSNYVSAFLLLSALFFFSGSVLYGMLRQHLQRQGRIPIEWTPAMREAANTLPVDWQAQYPFQTENLLPEETGTYPQAGENNNPQDASASFLLSNGGDALDAKIYTGENEAGVPAAGGKPPRSFQATRLWQAFLQKIQKLSGKLAEMEGRAEAAKAGIESTKTLLPCFQKMLELQAAANRWAGQRDFPGKGIALLDNGYLANDFPDFDRELFIDCADGLSRFSRWCDTQGIPMIYVQAPFKNAKYRDFFPADRTDYTNQMQDTMVQLLQERGVEMLDLREMLRLEMEQQALDPYGFFFVTDHHWNLRGGLWAAKTMADYLRKTHGLPLDSAILDPENFNEKNYPAWYLGSLGRTATRGYVEPDDFRIYLPNASYDLELINEDKAQDLRGGFWETLFNHEILEWKDDYRNSVYESLLYGNRPLTRILNHGKKGDDENGAVGRSTGTDDPAENGIKILFIRDSFSLACAPYFSLLVGETDLIDLRPDDGNFNGSVRTFIKENRPDAVLYLNYAGFKREIYDLR